MCLGTDDLTQTGDDTSQEQIAAENLNISGAPLNVFKLLGNHEQGKLIDLVGNGNALNGTKNVFDELVGTWVSPQTGVAVVTTPAWIGYDFGTLKTSYGQEAYGPPQPLTQHITSFRITQSTAGRRALQVRVERSNGAFYVDPAKIQYTGVGTGYVANFKPDQRSATGSLMAMAITPTQFQVFFTGATTFLVGLVNVGQRFVSELGSFDLVAGPVPFAVGDMFTLPIEQSWYRVDVVNLADNASAQLVRIKQSSAARYWRIVPTSFSGVVGNQPWEVDKLELFDFQATRLDDIQDMLFMENRDRDYAKSSLQIKVAYTPFDAISDLSKFGFQIADTWIFSTTYATMVKALGRPIVVGDVLELPSAMQYDHNLKPVRKFLEVIDTSWQADGYTTQWRPIIYRFQAAQLIPGQEHRDILGTVDTQKYVVDDGTFFDGVQQIQTDTLTAAEANAAEAQQAWPETGGNIRELASGTNRFGAPGSYDGNQIYVADALPPDGQPYTEGYKLPDPANQVDGTFFRLIYEASLQIPARLYRFNGIKGQWAHVETAKRKPPSSHKPSQKTIFERTATTPLDSKTL
jgi:hypothetical protein